MKYCANCNRMTPGQPLFCQFCSRTYDVKLCPRLHPNPRTAEVCSRCGSRDLSIPQPRVPWWAHALELIVPAIPGVLLTIGSLGAVIIVITALVQNPQFFVSAMFLSIALGILWAMWHELPTWVRSALFKLLKRLRERREHGGPHR